MAKKMSHKQAMRKEQKKKAQQGQKKTGPSAEHSEAVLEKVLSQRKPKTRKGAQMMKRREPQLVESSKTALVVRGNNASADVMTLLRDVHRLRHPLSVLYSRKHDQHPFEDVEPIEYLCKKFDHTLFVFGSTSKKRPFRLILGRMFNSTLLDMQEFNVTDYKSMQDFAVGAKMDASMGSKPLMLFQGPAFETSEQLKRTKSMLLDYFKGESPESVLLEGFEHVIVCTAGEEVSPGAIIPINEKTAASAPAPQPVQEAAAVPPVIVRRYHVSLKNSGAKEPRVELTEIGPRFTMRVDRVKEADRERWKQAIKVPKELKKKKVKNIKTESMGKVRANIHLGKQLFDSIHTVHHGKAKDKKLRADLAAQAKKKARTKVPKPSEDA